MKIFFDVDFPQHLTSLCGSLENKNEIMPNTKSAERRMRNSQRKRTHNRSIKSRLHSLERGYLQLVGEGKKTEAATALRGLSSAFDKAAKTGAIHRATADRKKSRLALRLGKTAQ